MSTTITELQMAIDSANNYVEKVEAFMALCKALSSPQYSNDLFRVSAEFLEIAENHEDTKSKAWAHLYNGMALSITGKFDEASVKFTGCLPMFELVGDKTGVARTLFYIGNIFATQSNPSRAYEYFQNALAVVLELNEQSGTRGDSNFLARIYINIGVITMMHLSDYRGAIENVSKAFELYQSVGNKFGESNALDMLGLSYWYLGDAGRSVEYALRGIAIAEEVGDNILLIQTLVNAAYPFMQLEDYQKVLELNKRAKALVLESGISDNGWVDMGISMALLRLGDVAGALEHAMKAIETIEQLNDIRTLGYAYFRHGEALVAFERYDTAFEAFNKSLDIRKSINTELEIAETQCELGKLLVQFGSYNEALTMLNEALELAEKVDGKAVIFGAHKALSQVYSSMEDFRKAFFHVEQYILIRDEVNSQENSKKAASMEYLHKQEIHSKEQEATDRILNNVLPQSITKRLKAGEKLIADTIPEVTVLFADVVGFTPLAARLSAENLVKLLAYIFKHFDDICLKHGLEKIKTIGDAYMAVAGAPDHCDDHAKRTATAAFDMLEDFAIPSDLLHEELKNLELDFRIGIHTGSAVAGVIGESKFAYDLWGDAVNTASRMESHGEAGKIHVSEEFRNMLISTTLNEQFVQFISRGEMDIKGKGLMKTYFLEKFE